MRLEIKSSCPPFLSTSIVLPPTSVGQWQHSGERNRSRLPGSPLPPLGSHRDRIKTSKTLLTRCFGTEACRRHALPFNGVKKPPRPHGTGRLTNARGRVGKLHGGCVDLHLRSVSVIVTAGRSLRVFGRNELTAAWPIERYARGIGHIANPLQSTRQCEQTFTAKLDQMLSLPISKKEKKKKCCFFILPKSNPSEMCHHVKQLGLKPVQLGWKTPTITRSPQQTKTLTFPEQS